MALITYEDKEDLNTSGILDKYKVTAEDMNKIKRALNEKLYSVGSVYVTSTKTNPGDILGGTWELIDKDLSNKTFVDSSIFTPKGSNIKNPSVSIARKNHSFNIRIGFESGVELSDGTVVLGTLNFKKIGVSRLFSIVQYLYAGSDEGNGYALCALDWNTGELSSLDVNCKGTATSIPADSQFYLQFWVVVPTDYLLDSECDKFYWKRTA